jgi:phosphohistidine phosphatase
MQPRRLVLVRHAQAADAPIDADRPLTQRGTRQATAIGGRLEQAGLVPDRAVVSPARRAVQTWELASAHLATDPPIVEERIYDNTVEALLTVLREVADDVRTVALVGHNPSIGELAAALDDGLGSPAARGELGRGFPTGTVAVFELAAPFTAIGPGEATLTDFMVPGD